MKELYCGIDVHKENYTGYVMDKQGKKIEEHSFKATKEAVEKFMCGIPSSRIKIAIEACSIWRAAHKILTELGYEVKLTNPRKIHEIAGDKKTDGSDARIIADLLRTGYLPEVYIPDVDVLRLRDTARHRISLVRLRTQVQHRIKSYLLREGRSLPFSRLWNKRGLECLRALGDPNINNFIAVYEQLKAQEREVEGRIRAIARNRQPVRLLMSITGIAEFSAVLIMAEIGDIGRFKNPKALVSYAGLCPGIHQSGSVARTVRKRAVNTTLKWIVTQCSGRAAQLDPALRRVYQRAKRKKGYQTARRVIARKMLTAIWHMLTKGEPYNRAA